MADEITAFETFFRARLLAIAEVDACIAERSFNSIAPPKTAFPYNVFTVVPLDDETGQARTSIQTRLLVDSKFLSKLPVDETIPAAVAATKEYFRSSTSFDFTHDDQSYRISVRHERPISYVEGGAVAEDRIIHRGGTFRFWMHKL